MSVLFGTKQTRAYTVLLIDSIFHALALFIAIILRVGGVNNIILGVGNIDTYTTTLVLAELFYAVMYIAAEKDEQDVILQGKFYMIVGIIKKQLMMLLFLMVFLFATKQSYEISRIIIVLFAVFDIIFEFIVRLIFKALVLVYARSGAGIDKILLVTLYDSAHDILSHLMTSGLKNVTGIVILDRKITGENIDGVPVIGDRDSIIDTGKKYVYDEVFLQIPYDYDISLESMLLGFEQMGVPVNLCVDVFGLQAENKEIGTIGPYHVIKFQDRSRKFFPQLAKRIMDICGAIVGLIFTGIIFIIFAPIIKATSKGPVFFSQPRVGMNGRQFKIYKFRTMVNNAEDLKKSLMAQNEMDGLMFKMANDPRVTKVGHFMRRTNLDEFPQFLNVLKGDMSLVGTRPPTVDEYGQYDNHHLRRLSIKPGITGLWQVSGRNNIKNFDDVVRLDLKYIDNWSLLLDIKIILQTVSQVFTGFPDPSKACDVLGVNIAPENLASATNKILKNYKQWSGKYICETTVHTTVLSYDDSGYRDVLNGSVLTLAAGRPLAVEAKKRGCTTIDRVAGPDLMEEIFARSVDNHLKHFFFGSTNEVLDELKNRLESKFPGIEIVGMTSPPFGDEFDAKKPEQKYIDSINEASADFVWVALSAPRQEQFMAACKDRVNGLMIGVGAGFDLHAGTQKRAPKWMQKMSMEWLYKLIKDPNRLMGRYMSTNWRYLRLIKKENKARKHS